MIVPSARQNAIVQFHRMNGQGKPDLIREVGTRARQNFIPQATRETAPCGGELVGQRCIDGKREVDELVRTMMQEDLKEADKDRLCDIAGFPIYKHAE